MSDPEVPSEWLTIPEVREVLQLSLDEWNELDTQDQTPAGVIWPDNVIRISLHMFDRWIDSLTIDPTEGEA
ncbi:hypothetical protein RIF23_15860 [Lipingzhangella sp. LS1_29]|uniref:Uncharacterized protein n=1 Tax=Lipingzhangella rawalii TaxID=2055835 RepID=A0ABU2H906_9ACTN|nr:hypothetical protein [Lipingzhangella rawalii]MDS1271771.1 hypothetical protein [Lipingzhangella rawalii]